MGDIFRAVRVCGFSAEHGHLGCEPAAYALLDGGSSVTVLSGTLARRIKAPRLPGVTLRLEGEELPAHLVTVHLDTKNCEERPLVVAVSDKHASKAGTDLLGKAADMILGHDYFQREHVGFVYAERTEEQGVACEATMRPTPARPAVHPAAIRRVGKR